MISRQTNTLTNNSNKLLCYKRLVEHDLPPMAYTHSSSTAKVIRSLKAVSHLEQCFITCICFYCNEATYMR